MDLERKGENGTRESPAPAYKQLETAGNCWKEGEPGTLDDGQVDITIIRPTRVRVKCDTQVVCTYQLSSRLLA